MLTSLGLEGYYDDTIFHRVVPGFIVQAGDPTGTGHGGQSVWDEPFADEFHSRLRYTRRGLLGMANSGAENDNGSQFFLTLAATPELQGKNTLFGRVAAGNSIYNVAALGEVELGEDDRPVYPPKIRNARVLDNPFDDIQPRSTRAEREQRMAEAAASEKRRQQQELKLKSRASKKLLSFADDDDEPDTVFVSKKKFKSSHDVGDDARLAKRDEDEEQRWREPKAKPKLEEKKSDDTSRGKRERSTTEQAEQTRSPPSESHQPAVQKDEGHSALSKQEQVRMQIEALKGKLSRKREPEPRQREPSKPAKQSLLADELAKYKARGSGMSRSKANGSREEDVSRHMSDFEDVADTNSRPCEN